MKKAFFLVLVLAMLFSGCVEPGPGTGNGADISKQLVEKGNKVNVEYVGKLENGEIFDSSEQHGQPLEFAAGLGQTIKGFDEAVLGMRLGEEKTVTIPPEKAYGFPQESKIEEIPKKQIADWENLEVGMPLHNNQTGVNGIVAEITENSIVVDFNPPLAGKTLIFWIKVVGIEKT